MNETRADWLFDVANQVHELVCFPDEMVRFRERVQSGIRTLRDAWEQRQAEIWEFLVEHPEYREEDGTPPANDWTWESACHIDEEKKSFESLTGWVPPALSVSLRVKTGH